jgi:beta-lactam-binding protein with PASTA domain
MKDIVVSVASSEFSLVDGSASMTVSVQNRTAAPERIVLSPVVADYTPLSAQASVPAGAGPAISIERALREVPAGMMEQYLVTFARGDTAPGRYDIKFIASPSEEATEEYAERAGRVAVVVPAQQEKPQPSFRWWPVVAAALAMLIVVVVGAFVLTRPDSVTVPDVVGRTQAEAQSSLASEGLRPAVTTTPGIKPLGVVVSQQPAAGAEVKKDAQVTVVVRSPLELVNVTALSADAAKAQLKALGFTKVSAVNKESRVPPGTVQKQDPQPKTPTALDDQITLTIATPVLVPVPDVIDLDEREAIVELHKAGLSVSLLNPCVPIHAGAQPGQSVICKVRHQQPAPNTRVPEGNMVTLNLAAAVG